MTVDLTKYTGHGEVDPGASGPPFLKIIQKGSAEFDVTHKQYATKKIEGCKPGDILFVPRSEILERPLIVLPVGQETAYAEWRPQRAGGGLVGHHPLSIVSDKRYSRKGNFEYLGENELHYTIYLLFLVKVGQSWMKAVIPFTSTGLKHARRWSRLLLNYKDPAFNGRPPVYARTWKLSSAPESNEKGSWFGWSFEPDARILDLPETEAKLMLDMGFEATNAAKADVQQLLLTTSPDKEDVPY